jgi:6,7-dimethyl-8-ribityllumazine synthase
MTVIVEGHLSAPKGAKIALLSSRFNDFIVSHLVRGAEDALIRHGINQDDIVHYIVPGAFELPLTAQAIAKSGKYDGIVVLGAVIRGATAHFDYVAGEATKGLANVSMQHNIPLGNAVLTVDTIEQAIERSGSKAGNKGAEAATTVIEMINLHAQI